MKKSSKALAMILALIITLSTAVTTAFASDTGKPGDYQTVATTSSTVAFIGTDNSLYVSGNGYYGQLGNGKNNSTTTPIRIMDDVVSVSCGYYHVAAIKSDGSLWMWGGNANGQLGTGNTTNLNTPIKVMDDVKAVSCGRSSACGFTAALKTDGTVWVWGDSSVGQTGSTRSSYTPVKVMDKVAAISCGNLHLAAIKTDDSLWMWGSNTSGQIAQKSSVSYKTSPVKVMDKVAAVSCGADHTAAIKTDGTLWTWGSNSYGQLGTGDTHDTNTPTKIMTDAKSVSCGTMHTGAVTTDNSAWIWGSGTDGKLFTRKDDKNYGKDYLSPMKVGNGIAVMYCGYWESIGVETNGNVWTCGYNGNNSLGYEGGDTTVVRNGSTFSVQSNPKLIVDYVAKLPASAKTDNKPTTPPEVKPSTGFSDVSPDAYYAQAVIWAVRNGITNGTGDGKFSPDQECTLAEMVTMLWRANGRPDSKTSCPFSLKPSSPFYTALCWAEEKAILDREGIGTTTIVTRSMMAQYVWRAHGCPNVNRIVDYNDVPRTASYATAVSWCTIYDITKGTSGNNFSPDAPCTRAQIVTFLYRAYAK